MKIRFLKTCVVEGDKPLRFAKGEVHDLVETSANRWIRRGAAVSVDEAETASLDVPEKAVKGKAKPKKAEVNDGADKDGSSGPAGGDADGG